jgi:hypothetical protein
VDKEVTSTSYLLPVVWLLFHCVVVVQSDIRVRGNIFLSVLFMLLIQLLCKKSAVRISFIYIHINVYIYKHTEARSIYIYTYTFLYLYTDMTHIHIYIYIFYIIYTLHMI